MISAKHRVLGMAKIQEIVELGDDVEVKSENLDFKMSPSRFQAGGSCDSV